MKKQILLKLMYIVGLFIFFSSCEPTEETKQEEEKIEFPANFVYDIQKFKNTYAYYIYDSNQNLIEITEEPSIMIYYKEFLHEILSEPIEDVFEFNFLDESNLQVLSDDFGSVDILYEYDGESLITPDIKDEFGFSWANQERFSTDQFKSELKRFTFTFASIHGEEASVIPTINLCKDITGVSCFDDLIERVGINYSVSKNDTIIYVISEFVYLKE